MDVGIDLGVEITLVPDSTPSGTGDDGYMVLSPLYMVASVECDCSAVAG